jgi:hypothetical protein
MLVRTRTERQYDFLFRLSVPTVFLIPLHIQVAGGGRPDNQAASSDHGSAFERKVVNPVLLPALFVVLSAERFLLTKADRFDSLRGYPTLHESLL